MIGSMIRRRRVGLTSAVLAFALSAGATNAAHPEDSPLLDATKRGDVVAVRSLLEGGADPDVARGDGLTALHLAAQQGSLEIAQLLIEAGANVEAKTRIGAHTSLHLARGGAHASVVRALIDAGADPTAMTSRTGVTPLHLAAEGAERREHGPGTAGARRDGRCARKRRRTDAPDVRGRPWSRRVGPESSRGTARIR